MDNISLADIDGIRKEGFRPEVVGCFINGGKILLLYNEEYDLWQLPQGGIDNGENIRQAVAREMNEELGQSFAQNMSEFELIGDDQVVFPTARQGSRDLKTDDGSSVHMKGKKYFFVLIMANQKDIDISQTEFDDYKWLTYQEALVLCSQIYQRGKKRITMKALNVLKEIGSLK